jgi:hypothetical protein
MTRSISILFALIALALLTPSSGLADPYPWCAQYAGGAHGGGRNCGFVTFEQCMATVSGIGGFCEHNLFYTGPVEHPRRHVRKRRHPSQ